MSSHSQRVRAKEWSSQGERFLFSASCCLTLDTQPGLCPARFGPLEPRRGLASAPQCAAGLSLPAHTQSLRGDNGHQSWGNLQLLLRKKEAGPWRKPATCKGRAQHQLEQGLRGPRTGWVAVMALGSDAATAPGWQHEWGAEWSHSPTAPPSRGLSPWGPRCQRACRGLLWSLEAG